MLIDWTEENFMDQKIVTATRKENVLDLVFTNTENMITSYETIVNSKLSDHNTLIISFNVEDETNQEKKKAENPYPNKIFEYNIRKGTNEDWIRYETLMRMLSKDFEEETKDKSTTEMLDKLIKTIEEVVELVFEKKEEFKSEGEKSKGNKIPRRVRLLMRKKKSLSEKIMKTNSVQKTRKLMLSLQKVEQELEINQRTWKNKKEKEALARIKKDPKYFYSYANRHAKIKNKIGPLINEKEETVKESFGMAEILRKQYESTFSQPREETAEVQRGEEEEVQRGEEEEVQVGEEEEMRAGEEEEEEVLDEVSLADFPFTYVDMMEAIDCLKPSSGPGPDGVSAILLKKAKTTIAMMLTPILRSSIETSDIPAILKTSFICPQLKPNSKREKAASWRPINLTSHIVKTWERVVRKKVVNYMEVNNLMDPQQHGSRQRRSCLSQLLEHYDEILQTLETGCNVDVVYTDFEKAYEKVDHKTLLMKMKTQFGIKDKAQKWFQAFLENRTQQVIIDGIKSTKSKVVSGAIQGSCLGPIIFLMYVCDMSNELETKPKLFVDDAKVKEKIEDENDVEKMQANLESLYKWQNENNMKFNGTKF